MAAKSQTGETYSVLKQDLLQGRFKPREKLRIDSLCETYEVSPGAVREALARLTSDGLVIAEPQRGFMVAPISTRDLIDLTSVRIEIETRCLRQSIQLGDLAWEGRILAVWHQLSRTHHLIDGHGEQINEDWAKLHSRFHDTLIEASDSPWWLRLRDQLYLQAERYRQMLLPYAKVDRDVHHEHEMIVQATLARDADLACELLRKHIQFTADILLGSAAPFDDAPTARESRRSPAN
jgi:GntR family transcriptional regulator, carbon starvation induced regulator